MADGIESLNAHVKRLQTHDTASLCWSNGSLVDWVKGGRILHIDGSVEESNVRYPYRFDAAIVSPCGQFSVIYEKLGTKGLVLQQGKILREISRSYYHAAVYEYPILILQDHSGRVFLLHCPNEYCVLELEDIQTGKRVPASFARKSPDFFHSRLRASPDGKWLLSAGWVWHPSDELRVFDLQAAWRDSGALDRLLDSPQLQDEVDAAEFLPDGSILLATRLEETSYDDPDAANSLAILSPLASTISSSCPAAEKVGMLMPLDANLAIGFHSHPKLFSLKTGAVLHRWEEIDSGTQTSSIIWHEPSPPVVACDMANRRFAVLNGTTVFVVDVPRGISG
jgi:hypothetical protein